MWNEIIVNKFWIQILHLTLRKYSTLLRMDNVVLSQHLCLPFRTKIKHGSAYPFLFGSQKCNFLQEPDQWLITSPNLSKDSLGTLVWDRKIHQLETCTGDVPASVTSVCPAGSPHAYKDHKTNITQKKYRKKSREKRTRKSVNWAD